MRKATSAYRNFFGAMLALPWLHACTSTPIGPAEARSSPSPAIPATSPSPSTPPPSDTPPTMTATPLSLPAFIPDRCRFQPEEGIEVECGDLIVPEDHQNPGNGRTVSLHIAIFKSTSDHPEPDPVIYLSGNANQLGSHAYYMEAGGYQILRARDYIMYNQRGAEYNQPELDCPDYAGLVMEHSPRHGPFSKEVDDDLVDWFLQCQQGLENKGVNLSAYNTYENAADVEDLRIALGYDQINLYGTSYGTLLGLTVMRHFPGSVRSVILDSVLPPQSNLYREGATNYYNALLRVFSACASDPICNAAYPDLERSLLRALETLTSDPLYLEINGSRVKLDAAFWLIGLQLTQYSATNIARIPQRIYAAEQGKIDLILENMLLSLLGPGEEYEGLRYSVHCHDIAAHDSHQATLAMGADLPPQFVEAFDAYFEFQLCPLWNSGQADPKEHSPVVSDLPALIFAGEFDPITPPHWGSMVSETLESSFFYTFTGQSHGVMRSTGFAQKMGLEFLEYPFSAPDAACMEQLSPPPFK